MRSRGFPSSEERLEVAHLILEALAVPDLASPRLAICAILAVGWPGGSARRS